jgi:hypothetical protein
MNKITILAGTALLGVAGVALAQTAAPQRTDRNADVTRQQVVERVDQRFARMDANNDGRFTPEEMRAAGEARRAERQTRMFDRMDLDRNGSITREEMSQAHAQMRENRGERGMRGQRRGMRHGGAHHGGPAGAEGPGHGGANAGTRGARMFGEQGFITREQMRERALARFDRADANRDGTLTAAERQAARGAMRQQRRERRPG